MPFPKYTPKVTETAAKAVPAKDEWFGIGSAIENEWDLPGERDLLNNPWPTECRWVSPDEVFEGDFNLTD